MVEQAGREVLVYDERSAEAHCLSAEAAAVWRACDGQTTREQIIATLELDAETVGSALAELERCALLETFEGPKTDGVTRREATVRLAKAGAAAAAAPLIYSIVAPTPAVAASEAFCVGLGCSQDCGDCHQHHCSCCVGSPSGHVCVADCTSANCNTTVIKSCFPGSTKVSCN